MSRRKTILMIGLSIVMTGAVGLIAASFEAAATAPTDVLAQIPWPVVGLVGVIAAALLAALRSDTALNNRVDMHSLSVLNEPQHPDDQTEVLKVLLSPAAIARVEAAVRQRVADHEAAQDDPAE
jgi:hypothetical protein